MMGWTGILLKKYISVETVSVASQRRTTKAIIASARRERARWCDPRYPSGSSSRSSLSEIVSENGVDSKGSSSLSEFIFGRVKKVH